MLLVWMGLLKFVVVDSYTFINY